jgi:hypothetical protein
LDDRRRTLQDQVHTFVKLLGLDRADTNRPKNHNQAPLPTEEMKFMYPRREIHRAGKACGLYTYYSILNRLLRKTLTPRGGNHSDISLHARNLLARLRLGGEEVSVADFIWEEIKYISENPLKICGFAPYLMVLVERATRMKFGTDVKHKSIRSSVPKQRIIPSPHRYSEGEEEAQHDQGIREEEQHQFHSSYQLQPI